MGVAWMNADRFALKTERVGECLIWQGRGRVGPYGVAGYHGQHWLAHRLAYHFATGENLGPEDVVMHTCDTPLCVEPTHLVRGTHGDNVRDKVQKGRQLAGERHPLARLTREQVHEVRRRVAVGELQKDVAADFGVSFGQVSKIVRGQRWRAE